VEDIKVLSTQQKLVVRAAEEHIFLFKPEQQVLQTKVLQAVTVQPAIMMLAAAERVLGQLEEMQGQMEELVARELQHQFLVLQ
jgi:hypothetical protein